MPGRVSNWAVILEALVWTATIPIHKVSRRLIQHFFKTLSEGLVGRHGSPNVALVWARRNSALVNVLNEDGILLLVEVVLLDRNFIREDVVMMIVDVFLANFRLIHDIVHVIVAEVLLLDDIRLEVVRSVYERLSWIVLIQIKHDLIINWLHDQVFILHRGIQFTDELLKILILIKVLMDTSLFNIDIQFFNMLYVEFDFIKDITLFFNKKILLRRLVYYDFWASVRLYFMSCGILDAALICSR